MGASIRSPESLDPAILHLLQNNRQYVAVEKLDAATYSATYQTKIIWVGVLSVLLLNHKLPCSKWSGLVMLTFGVVFIQVGGHIAGVSSAGSFASYENRVAGAISALMAAGCSSLAGVYFEKILKGVKISVWARNFQLAAYSVFTGYLGLVMAADKEVAFERGLLYGFTNCTWARISMNDFGGSAGGQCGQVR